MKKVLGISAYFHDSSAVLIVGDEIVAAALEERFTRKKHDSSLPVNAIAFCLSEAGVSINELNEVVFFEKPFTKFERILDNYSKQVPRGFWPFQKAIRTWLQEKFWVEDKFRKHFKFKGDFLYSQHHFSHAINACYQSRFKDAAYLIVDGVGEKACTTFGVYQNGEVIPVSEQHFPHSIGLLYSAFTQYCGFKVNSGEYKLMGLAPYGKPVYKKLIYDNFVSVSNNGVVKLSLSKFGFLNGLKMINKHFEKVFDQPAREKEGEMTQFYKDVAASIQKVTEEILVNLARYVLDATNKKNLVLGGGVALNCVANSVLLKELKVEQIYAHSASGDGGCALGAALWRSELVSNGNSEFLGPSFSKDEIKKELNKYPLIQFEEIDDAELYSKVAGYLAEDKVVGWFHGRMEFGPRALGNRSILANPRNKNMQSILNLKIKKREGFRPFAPVVLDEFFNDYFVDNRADYSNMLFVTEGTGNASKIPSCIHQDNTARVQRLKKEFNPKLFQLLSEFNKLTGVPVLINTSFNERGEPIVCTPKEALQCFFNTEMDVLVMENILVRKEENDNVEFKSKRYELD